MGVGESYELGWRSGYPKGYEDGTIEAKNRLSYDQGFEKGRNVGIKIGKQEIQKQGYDEGYSSVMKSSVQYKNGFFGGLAVVFKYSLFFAGICVFCVLVMFFLKKQQRLRRQRQRRHQRLSYSVVPRYIYNGTEDCELFEKEWESVFFETVRGGGSGGRDEGVVALILPREEGGEGGGDDGRYVFYAHKTVLMTRCKYLYEKLKDLEEESTKIDLGRLIDDDRKVEEVSGAGTAASGATTTTSKVQRYQLSERVCDSSLGMYWLLYWFYTGRSCGASTGWRAVVGMLKWARVLGVDAVVYDCVDLLVYKVDEENLEELYEVAICMSKHDDDYDENDEDDDVLEPLKRRCENILKEKSNNDLSVKLINKMLGKDNRHSTSTTTTTATTTST